MSNTNVPFVDLRAQHEEVRGQIEAAIADVIDRSSFIGGSYVSTFEREFANNLGAKEVVGLANGTDAVWLALVIAGVKPGDAVITVPNTFIATTEAITRCGAIPLFVDCALDTASMDMSALKEFLGTKCVRGDDGSVIALKSKCRVAAILPVHLYGLPVDIETLMQIAKEYALPVVEDACQAHGARYKVNGELKRAGTVGLAAGFSFYPGKNLGAMGDGGALATNDAELADRVRYLRDHGSKEKYVHITPDGWNSRLDAMQAAILSIKLKKLDEWNSRRRQVAAWYAERLASDERIVLPLVPEGRQHIYHLYVVRVPNRDRILKELSARGVGCGLHYPIPLHLQVAYRDLGYISGDFPVTEETADSILSLPMFPHMTEEMVDFTCQTLKELL